MKNLPFPTSMQHIALRVARHEAGHYVVARALGFRVGGLSIEFNDYMGAYRAGSEVTLPTSLQTIPQISDYLRRRVKVLYAGVLSEAMVNGEIDGDKALEYIRTGGKDDHSKVRELVNALRSIEYGETQTDYEAQQQLNNLDNELWSASADIVVVEKEVIESLAQCLASKVKFIGVPCAISKSDLDALPALIKRFGS